MLIVLTGTDRYRIALATEREIDALKREHDTTATVVRVRGTDTQALDTITRPLRYPSLVGGHTVIVISDAATADIADLLQERTPSDITVLAVQYAVKPTADVKKALATLERSADRTDRLDALSGTERQAWIGQFCRARGCRIERTAAQLADTRSGGDTWALALLLDQLCAYAGPQGDIGTETVAQLTSSLDPTSQWALTDALFSGDKRAALTALWRALQDGTPPQLVLGMATSATRALLAAHTAPGSAGPLGIHPFIASKAARGARHYQAEAVRRAHEALAALDRDSKDGRADTVDGMFRVLLDL
jgi:DNA polymerase III delta subunit